MFRRSSDTQPAPRPSATTDRVTSVLGPGTVWKGDLSGSGGVRIEGALEGDISLHGLLVIGETGRVTSNQLRANVVIVAGAVRGDITAEKIEIRSTGRVWGNVVTAAFATEEGAFLRGQIRMEDQVDMSVVIPAEESDSGSQSEPTPADEQVEKTKKDPQPKVT